MSAVLLSTKSKKEAFNQSLAKLNITDYKNARGCFYS
jgi:hypothetical protein